MMHLSWDGTTLNASGKGQLHFEVPSINDFKVLEVSSLKGDEQCLQIRFSDPLDLKQDLLVLISIKKDVDDNKNTASGNKSTNNDNESNAADAFKFIIESNIIKAFPNDKMKGEVIIEVAAGIKNVIGRKLPHTMVLSFHEPMVFYFLLRPST